MICVLKPSYTLIFNFYFHRQCLSNFLNQQTVLKGQWDVSKYFHMPTGFFCLFVCLVFFAISWAAPTAHGGSQARGVIGAVAAGPRQSHSNARSEPHLQAKPQLTATPDP